MYTLSGVKCILFLVRSVYTFTRGEYTLLRKSVGGCARECRGLHPRVPGDASRSVGRIAKNVNFPLAFGGGIWDNTRCFERNRQNESETCCDGVGGACRRRHDGRRMDRPLYRHTVDIHRDGRQRISWRRYRLK